MIAYPRLTHRHSHGSVIRIPHIVAFALMILLGSLTATLVASAAADMGIGQRDAHMADQPAQPLGTASSTATTVEVTVTVHWCPSGTNPDTVENGEAIKSACTLQGPPINVALVRISENSTVPMTRTISSFPGTATYVNVQPGTYGLLGYHTQAEHNSGLFCTRSLPDDTTNPYARVVEESPVDMVAGEKIACDWFGELTGKSTVTLTTWNCPEGFDFATAGYDTAKKDCTEPVNAAVTFSLTNVLVTPPYEKTVEAGPDVTEQDVPLGTLTVSETVPPDYSLVAVVCTSTSTVNPGQTTENHDVPLTGANTFELTVPAQGTLTCDVFHTASGTAESTPMATPAVDGISVTIFSWECVSGTLTGQPMSYYQGEEQCEGEKPDVVFDVTDAHGTQQTTSVEDGRHIDGLVGEVTIREHLPADYELPAIFCSPLTGQPGQELAGSGDFITLPPRADGEYQCSFYNIPSGTSATGTGDVLVYTYACASTPPPKSNYAWYFQNCTGRQNGASFVLDTPDADIHTTSGDVLDGAVTMRGQPPGEYSLTETATVPNYETGAVFCAVIGKAEIPGPAQMMPQQVRDNSISAPVTADTLFYCQWYHVPAGSMASPAP